MKMNVLNREISISSRYSDDILKYSTSKTPRFLNLGVDELPNKYKKYFKDDPLYKGYYLKNDIENFLNEDEMFIPLDDRFITPYFSDIISHKPNKKDIIEKPKRKSDKNKFIIGDIYSLTKEDCGEFELPTKKYKLIGVINTVNEIDINSLVMKQVEGEQSLIFSLSKMDCKLFNIPFEQGLQLFPQNLGWVNHSLLLRQQNQANIENELVVKENEKEMFDPMNLATYPICITDNTIRHMMIKISGCRPIGLNKVLLPNNTLFDGNLKNLIVTLNKEFIGDGYTSSTFRRNENIRYNIMTSKISTCYVNNLVDVNGCMFIELCFYKPTLFRGYKDGYIGVNVSNFLNCSISDIVNFNVTQTSIKEETKQHILSLIN